MSKEVKRKNYPKVIKYFRTNTKLLKLKLEYRRAITTLQLKKRSVVHSYFVEGYTIHFFQINYRNKTQTACDAKLFYCKIATKNILVYTEFLNPPKKHSF